jgi:hypothetical protein
MFVWILVHVLACVEIIGVFSQSSTDVTLSIVITKLTVLLISRPPCKFAFRHVIITYWRTLNDTALKWPPMALRALSTKFCESGFSVSKFKRARRTLISWGLIIWTDVTKFIFSDRTKRKKYTGIQGQGENWTECVIRDTSYCRTNLQHNLMLLQTVFTFIDDF